MEELVRYIINHTEKGDSHHCSTCTKRLTKECDSILIRDFWLCSANNPKRKDFIGLIHKEFPVVAKLSSGISFPRLEEIFGNRILTLRFMGLGALLDLWDILPPAPMGIKREDMKKAQKTSQDVIYIRPKDPSLQETQPAGFP